MNSPKFSFYALSLLVCLSLVFTNGLFAQANMKSSTQGFIQNKGQVLTTKGERADNVLFQLGKPGVEVFILNDLGISFQFEKHYSRKISLVAGLADVPVIDSTETFRVNMHLKNANLNAALVLTDSSSDYINYYRPDLIQTRTFGTVTFKDVYRGIDWKIYTTNEGVKYDFIVHPGANPKDIQMVFSDQEKLFIDAEGSLIQECSLGSFIEKKPVSFQGDSFIETNFILRGNEVSFKVAGYDESSDLIIDPDRIWATYYGGELDDVGVSSATDAFQNVYLCGYTYSQIGIASNGLQLVVGGNSDFFLVKFNSDGIRLWGTYFGGENYEYMNVGRACAVDLSNNVYLVGSTLSTGGISNNGFQNTYGGGSYGDGVVIKFNPEGGLLWSTYYGGGGDDSVIGCAVDRNNDLIVTGYTSSGNNISLQGAQNIINPGSDGYVAKIGSNGGLIWGTYFGGNGDDMGISCAVDSAGSVYSCGFARSTDLNTSGGDQSVYGGDLDGYLVKYSSDGAFEWATYLGGTLPDACRACAVSSNQKVHIAGWTFSQNNIFYNGHQQSHGGDSDAFFAQYNSTGEKNWSTYFGGAGGEGIYDCAADLFGNVYVAGASYSSNNVNLDGFQNSFIGENGMLAKFSDSGNLLWGTLHGGISVCLDGQGSLYFSGTTGYATPDAFGFQETYGGGQSDAFLIKVSNLVTPAQMLNLGNDTIVCLGNTIQLNAGEGYSSYLWSNGATTSLINVSPSTSGWYSCQITVENQTFSDSLFITVNPNSVWFGDADGDFYGTIVNSVMGCIQPVGYVSNGTDCNDNDAIQNPIATETCNNLDDNCNNQIDEGLSFFNYYSDSDGDGFGTGVATSSCIDLGAGYTLNNTDCDDSNSVINPNAEEIGANGIDENCDGQIDNSIEELSNTLILYPNPATTELNLQITSDLIGTDLFVFDALGKQILKQQILSTNTFINTSSFAAGNYVVKVGGGVKKFEVVR